MASIIKEIASSFYRRTVPGETIQFLGQFDIQGDPLNGLVLNGSYIPQEILVHILTYLTPSDILKCSLVCKNWHNVAKSNALWHDIYNYKEYPKKAKKLPWYVFYCFYATDNFTNLIKNGNGQKKFKHWNIVANEGDKFIVEQEPCGSQPLPAGKPEFFGHTSCFATSYQQCAKYQEIDLKPKRLLRYIIGRYKPVLFGSEWFTGRFDCAASYQLSISCTIDNEREPYFLKRGVNNRVVNCGSPDDFVGTSELIEQWADKPWEKKDLYLTDYSLDIMRIRFYHEGKDRQFWKGHYGSKMAGGVLKFLLDSIEPIPEDIN